MEGEPEKRRCLSVRKFCIFILKYTIGRINFAIRKQNYLWNNLQLNLETSLRSCITGRSESNSKVTLHSHVHPKSSGSKGRTKLLEDFGSFQAFSLSLTASLCSTARGFGLFWAFSLLRVSPEYSKSHFQTPMSLQNMWRT